MRGDPNNGHIHVAVAVGQKVYYFGGKPRGQKNQLNVYVFNTVSLTWMKIPPVTTTRGKRPLEVPCLRIYHTGVLIEDIVYIWGGNNLDAEFNNNMLYAFDVDTHRWLNSEISGTVPEARWGHSACVLGKVMYVYGGVLQQHTLVRTNDIYKLDTATMVWSLISTRGIPLPDSAWHSATIIGTKMFVFGGGGDPEACYSIIRVFDTETNSWLNIPSSQLLREERRLHAAFAYNGELYIFGGYESVKEIAMWKFIPETLSRTEVKPKGNDSFWMSMSCCCMVGDRVVLLGGFGEDTRNGDLFVFDFSPSLKTLCLLAVIQYGLEQSQLPHNIRWELAAMADK